MYRSALKPVVLVASLLLAPLAVQAATHPNLVVNGSFEKDPVTLVRYFGANDLSGWEVQSNIKVREEAGTPADGPHYAELDAYRNGAIRQHLATQPGHRYKLSFRYSNRSGTPVESNGLRVVVGDYQFDAPTLPPNYSGGNLWVEHTVSFTATSDSTLLAFQATGTSDAVGSSLDDIRVIDEAAGGPAQGNALFGALAIGAAGASVAWRMLRQRRTSKPNAGAAGKTVAQKPAARAGQR